MIVVDMSSSPFLPEALNWCEDNTKDNWDFDHRDVLTPAPKFFFKFNNERDATTFILKWYRNFCNEQQSSYS